MSRDNLIQFRKGTLAQFNSVNPTLSSGEPGFALDAKVLKVGDGVTPWSGLLGFSVGSGISSINSLTSSALLINGGHNIEVTTSGTEIIHIAYTGLEHIVTDSLSNVNNSGNTFIQDLLFDQFGHVTGVVSVAVTGTGSGGSVPSNVLVSGDNISFLTNDADYDTIPKYNLTAAGSSAYLFNGPGLSASSSNPTLYFHRGHTYKFVNNMGAHPFQFQTTAGLGGTAYTGGITGSPVSNGTLTWEVRHDTPSVLYYQCTAHASMQGTVYILATGTGSSVPSNVATTGELISVSGHLQSQIDVIPTGAVSLNSVSSGFIPKLLDDSTLTNSVIFQSGARIGVGTDNPLTAIHIVAPSGNEGTILSRTLDSTSWAGLLIRNKDNQNVASFQYGNNATTHVPSLQNTVLIGSRRSGVPVKFYQGAELYGAFRHNNERIIFDVDGNTILTAASGFKVIVSGLITADGFTIPGGASTQLLTADGGITTGPTNAIVGDNPGGREAVIPLDVLMKVFKDMIVELKSWLKV